MIRGGRDPPTLRCMTCNFLYDCLRRIFFYVGSITMPMIALFPTLINVSHCALPLRNGTYVNVVEVNCICVGIPTARSIYAQHLHVSPIESSSFDD